MAVTAPDDYGTKKKNNGSSWNTSGRTGGTTSTGDVRVYGKPESVYTPPAQPSGGGSYVAPSAPSAPAATPSYNPYKDLLAQQEKMYADMMARQQQQYEAEQRAREEMLAQQKKQAQAAYESRVQNVNTGADEILRQAYISRMQDERTLPQQLRSLGVSGGASETTLQNLKANYANNRQRTESERLSAIDQAAADRDSLHQAAYSDFLQSNISSLRDYNSRYNELAMMQAQAQAEAAAAEVAANASSTKNTTYSSSDVMKSAGYKYAADLLGAGYSNEQIYTTMKNAGFADAQIAEYLYLMGF